MKRMTFFPGASEALVKQLASKFNAAKEPGKQFTAQVGALVYSGPVKVQDGAVRWYVEASKLAEKASKQAAPPAKAKPAPKKKAAPKKNATPKKGGK